MTKIDILEKIEEKTKIASRLIKFDITYIPGVTEEFDKYKATHEALKIYCYGATKKRAIASAQMEASAWLMAHSSVLDLVLKEEVQKLSRLKKKD
jgi:hypothetical protein